MANFIPQLEPGSCEFLNLRLLLRSQPCIHCGSRDSLKAHGFLRRPNQMIRGIRFYCSSRDSNRGCGKTFSIHFENSIPNASLSTQQVNEIITSNHQLPHAQKTLTPSKIAKSTRSRWLKKFDTSQFFIRSQLYLVTGPDKNATGSICSLTLQHIRRAFPGSSCVMTAFQRVLQANPFDHRTKGLPIYHRALSDWLSWILVTTRNGTAISDETSIHHFPRPILTFNSC